MSIRAQDANWSAMVGAPSVVPSPIIFDDAVDASPSVVVASSSPRPTPALIVPAASSTPVGAPTDVLGTAAPPDARPVDTEPVDEPQPKRLKVEHDCAALPLPVSLDPARGRPAAPRPAGSGARSGTSGPVLTQQLFLDAGQKRLGEITCPHCALVYYRGVPADEATHRAHCEPVRLGVAVPAAVRARAGVVVATVPAVALLAANTARQHTASTSASTSASAAFPAAPRAAAPPQQKSLLSFWSGRAASPAMGEATETVPPRATPLASAPSVERVVADANNCARVLCFRAAQVAAANWVRHCFRIALSRSRSSPSWGGRVIIDWRVCSCSAARFIDPRQPRPALCGPGFVP